MPTDGTSQSIPNRTTASLSRRDLVKMMGAGASASAIAGCVGDDDDDDAEGLGETVEPLLVHYTSTFSAAPIFTDVAEVVEIQLETAGFPVEVESSEGLTAISAVNNDERLHHLYQVNLTANPARHDAHELINDLRAESAGGNGQLNWSNWVNCDYDELAREQRVEGDVEARRELVNECYKMISEAYIAMPTMEDPILTVFYTDNLDVSGHEAAGLSPANPHSIIQTEPTSGDSWDIGSPFPGFTNRNPFIHPNELSQMMWQNLVYSPLVGRDTDLALQPILAEDWDVEDNGQLFRFHLRDATFHDGSQVTAEDVKFTFSVYQNFGADLPKGASMPFEDGPEEDIVVVDNTTVEFHFNEPNPVFVEGVVPRYGIWSRDHVESEGYLDDIPGASFDEFIGSGPFEMRDFQVNERGTLVPFEDHPVFSPESTVTVHSFDQHPTLASSLEAGELDAASRFMPDIVANLEDSIGDQIEVATGANIHPAKYWVAANWGPTQFVEYRQAVGMSLNRNEITDISTGGYSEPIAESTMISDTHPWWPENDDVQVSYTDDMSGDPEGARALLEENGWGWDDNDNLRYPEDYDPSAQWPAEETPDPENFECLGEDG